jgi:hypothetical protein
MVTVVSLYTSFSVIFSSLIRELYLYAPLNACGRTSKPQASSAAKPPAAGIICSKASSRRHHSADGHKLQNPETR